MQRIAAALLAFGSLTGLLPMGTAAPRAEGEPRAGVAPRAEVAPRTKAAQGPVTAPRPGPSDRGLTMDLVLTQVDRTLAARPGRFAHPIALTPSARGAERTRAPYFVVPSAPDRGTESLPLEASHAEIQVAGVMAEVRLTQAYRNRGRMPIEAIYLFPVSTRAAVHGLRLRMGGRVVEARVALRPEATTRYLVARRQGMRAALLLEERSNLLALRIANLMPGERVDVEVTYSELLLPDDGWYELVLPRAVGAAAIARDLRRVPRWLLPPRLPAGQSPPFSLDLHLTSPVDLGDARSPSHPRALNRRGPREVVASLREGVDEGSSEGTGTGTSKGTSRGTSKGTSKGTSEGTSRGAQQVEGAAATRDFVLRYRLAGKGIAAGALTHTEGGELHFLLMMTPPDRPALATLPPREYIFVLDVSGSMAGFPLRTAQGLLRSLLATLRPVDRFNLVLFAGKTRVLGPRSLPAEASAVAQALRLVAEQQGAGQTDLLGALRTAYALPRPEAAGLSRSILVITDGYVAVQAETFRFVRRRLGEANGFAFGIGASVDRALIEGLARAGNGTPFVVTRASEAQAAATRLQSQMAAPVLTGLQVKVEGAKAFDLMPEALPDLFAGRPLVLFGKLQGGPGRLHISGSRGAAPFYLAVPLPAPGTGAATRPLRALWARAWAEELTDQLAMLPGDPGLGAALGRLGVHYGLLTPMTGFVAVDRRVNRTGSVTEVVQPLPPAGSVEAHLGGRLLSQALEAAPAEPDAAPGTAEAEGARRSPLHAAPACRRQFGGCGCQGAGAGPEAGPESGPEAGSGPGDHGGNEGPGLLLLALGLLALGRRAWRHRRTGGS